MYVLYGGGSIKKTKKAIIAAINESVATGFSAMATPAAIAMNRAMLTGMIGGYAKKYGKRDLKAWKIHQREVKIVIPKIFGSAIDFIGIIDAIVEIKAGPNKGIWILEHKTTKDLSYYTVEAIKKAIQTLAYIYTARKFLGLKPKGIIWNAVRKPSKRLKKNQTVDEYCTEIEEDYIARPAFYFYRQELRVNRSSVDEWVEEAHQQIMDLEICYTNKDNIAIWYKNTSLCDMYGGCEFAPLCYRGDKRSTLSLFRPITHE